MSLPLQTASLKPFHHLVADSAASSSRNRLRCLSSSIPPRRPSYHLVVTASAAAADPNPSSDLSASPAKPRGSRPKGKSPPEEASTASGGISEDFPTTIPRKPRRGRRSEAAAVEDFVRDRLERTFSAIREQSAEVLDGKEDVLKDRMEVEEAAAVEGEGVVEEEDSEWPLDADVGWGTRASDYFEKHPIKNVVEDGVEIDWEGEMEEGWVKEINCLEWESFAFHPSPLIVLVFERYRKAMDNWKFLKELEKAVKVYWNAKDRLPPRAFVKAQKTRAYFKRFQVKFKRRREGKTDYRARIRLINQDKNKYNTPKYRFVVRFTNKDITAQIISASIAGDLVLASAYSHELPRYGLEVGLTNYAAAYCTGLLLARRVLKMLELDEEYEGNVEAIGEDFSVEPTESRRPFRALLDVGLIRTTTGNRVFGALKGALDGGLDIPHSDKRFAGFKKDGKELDAEVHRKYIYGVHVASYMKTMLEDEPEKYQSHFSEYVKRGIEADNMEELYKKVHAAIRADPAAVKSIKEAPKEHKRYNLKKLTYDERKARLIERLNALNSSAGADDDEDEE